MSRSTSGRFLISFPRRGFREVKPRVSGRDIKCRIQFRLQRVLRCDDDSVWQVDSARMETRARMNRDDRRGSLLNKKSNVLAIVKSP